MFVVPRLSKQVVDYEAYVHKSEVGYSGRNLPINKLMVLMFYIVSLIKSNYLQNHYLVVLQNVK